MSGLRRILLMAITRSITSISGAIYGLLSMEDFFIYLVSIKLEVVVN